MQDAAADPNDLAAGAANPDGNMCLVCFTEFNVRNVCTKCTAGFVCEPCNQQVAGLCVICDREQLNEEHNVLSDDSDSDGSGPAIIAQHIVDIISHRTRQTEILMESVQIYEQFEAGDVAGAAARWNGMLAEARTLDWSNYEADFVKSLVDDLNHAIHIGELGMPYVYLSDASSDSDSSDSDSE